MRIPASCSEGTYLESDTAYTSQEDCAQCTIGHFCSAASVQPLSFASNPPRRGLLPGGLNGSTEYPALYGWVARDAAGAGNATLLNQTTAQAPSVDLSGTCEDFYRRVAGG